MFDKIIYNILAIILIAKTVKLLKKSNISFRYMLVREPTIVLNTIIVKVKFIII